VKREEKIINLLDEIHEKQLKQEEDEIKKKGKEVGMLNFYFTIILNLIL
jgi:hypothetical protein